MDDSFEHLLIFTISMIGAILVILIISKTGIVQKIISGDLWREAQDKRESNTITY